MKLGDQICILLGSKTPVVLRKNIEQSCYKLVGHAYVHGVMHGEALSWLTANRKLDLTTRVGIWPIKKKFCLV